MGRRRRPRTSRGRGHAEAQSRLADSLDAAGAVRSPASAPHTLAYAAHNVELFAFRTWVVAFLTFSQGLQAPGTPGARWSATTIAALLNLASLPASVLGNEVATRVGRLRTLAAVMFASAAVAATLGFSAPLPFPLVLGVLVLYGVTIIADSATLTAGLVEVADAGRRGTTMAAHSLVGFLGAALGPVLFGAVLDTAGGETVPAAWGLAFATMGLAVATGPAAVWWLAGHGGHAQQPRG